jgi:hypothetical protein
MSPIIEIENRVMQKLFVIIGVFSLTFSLGYQFYYQIKAIKANFTKRDKDGRKFFSKSVNWVSGLFLLIAAICLAVFKILE